MDATDVEIRPLESGDIVDLWRLKRGFELGLGSGTGSDEKRDAYEAKLTAGYRAKYLDWVGWCIERDERAVHVADAGEALVGYAFVLPDDLSMIWDAAVLNEIYVDPEFRGTGIADDLMDAVVATARDQDLPLSRLVLDVDRENDRARSFYERHGFEHWGEMVAREI